MENQIPIPMEETDKDVDEKYSIDQISYDRFLDIHKEKTEDRLTETVARLSRIIEYELIPVIHELSKKIKSVDPEPKNGRGIKRSRERNARMNMLERAECIVENRARDTYMSSERKRQCVRGEYENQLPNYHLEGILCGSPFLVEKEKNRIRKLDLDDSSE